MNKITNFFIKPLNSTAMNAQNPLPRVVWDHLTLVYCTLFYTSIFALLGAFVHLFFNIGGLITALGIVPSLWLMSKINPWREFRRVIFLMLASFLFGATIGPLINLITEIEQRLIIKIIMGGVVFFSCHFGAILNSIAKNAIYQNNEIRILNSIERNAIYQSSEFTAPFFITAWMVISETYSGLLMHIAFLVLLPFSWYVVACFARLLSFVLRLQYCEPIHLAWFVFLSYFFDYPFLDFLLVNVIVSWFWIHMKMHSQEAIYIATHNSEENYYVKTALTFYTEYIARSIYLNIQFVSLSVGKLRGFWWLNAKTMIVIVIVILVEIADMIP